MGTCSAGTDQFLMSYIQIFSMKEEHLTGRIWLCYQGLGQAEGQRDLCHLQSSSGPWPDHMSISFSATKKKMDLFVSSPSTKHESTNSISTWNWKHLQAEKILAVVRKLEDLDACVPGLELQGCSPQATFSHPPGAVAQSEQCGQRF